MTQRRRGIAYVGPVASRSKTWIVSNGVMSNMSSSRTSLSDSFKPLNGSQVTDSESHPAWRDRKRDHFKGDLGGPFFTQKRYAYSDSTEPVTLSGSRVVIAGVRTDFGQYIGPMLPASPSVMGYPAYAHSNNDTLDELGTVAIARCSPSNPTADVATFLGELLKDGLPHLIGDTLHGLASMTWKQRRKAIASEHLNVEFGWKPIISDLRKFASMVVHADSVLKQYERGSGSMVRRRFVFDTIHNVDTVTAISNASPWIGPSPGIVLNPDTTQVNKGSVLRQTETVKRQWFSGAFTYYVPPSEGIRNNIARHVILAKKLLGLPLTPDTIWELTPWSWAVDWFSDTSEVLRNWTNWIIDNQVLLYGYMMEHSIARSTYTFAGPTGYMPPDKRPPNVVLTSEVKQRRQATPFGFGVDLSTLSNRQKAIAASVAISRQK